MKRFHAGIIWVNLHIVRGLEYPSRLYYKAVRKHISWFMKEYRH